MSRNKTYLKSKAFLEKIWDFNSEPIGSKYMQPYKESVTKQQAYVVH